MYEEYDDYEMDGMGEDSDDVEIVDDVVYAAPVNNAPNGSQESSLDKKVGLIQDLATTGMALQTRDPEAIMLALEQFSKSQLVRFMDVTIIGPLLLYWAYKGKLSPAERTIMGLIGLGTVIYNGRNFMKNKQMMPGQSVAQMKDMLRKA
jgi:hypothetical protein